MMFYANYKWMLIVCFLVHVIFLISIFDIYFKSPIVRGIPSQRNWIPPLAKRLVLFVGDGLRADSFFEANNQSEFPAPYLREIIEKRGRWGISHTRVPTESRPGHVAILAGFYEDPSAIFSGWKNNPIDFDSVINQSEYTLGYGSPDILSMFSKNDRGGNEHRIRMQSYPESFEDFSGIPGSATRLSLWSLHKFKDDIERSKKMIQDRIVPRYGEKIIIFLHLLGIDTAGHSDKPHSDAYMQNIKVADDIVRDTEQIVRDFYQDNDTAFIFTSDHGMTNWGSHGEGSIHETETPFVAWGAGIVKPKPNKNSSLSPDSWKLNHLQRNDLKQADIAPLISLLLGIPIPVNSVGILPIDILRLAAPNKTVAMLLNARQILAQFNKKRELVENTTLKALYKPYEKLSHNRNDEIIESLLGRFQRGEIEEVFHECFDLISLCLSGLDYYHNYYQRLLLFCIAVSYIGWIGWLFLNVLSNDEHKFLNSLNREMEKVKKNRLFVLNAVFLFLILTTASLLYVQTLPLQYYLYCGLPLVIWWNVFKKIIVSHSTTNYKGLSRSLVFTVFLTVIGTEIVILSFFQRRLLSIVIITLAVWLPSYEQKNKLRVLLSVLWVFSCLLLAVFPFLSVIGEKPNNAYLILNALMWCLFIGICWVITSQVEVRRKISHRAVKIFILYVTLFGLAVCNVVYVTYTHGANQGLNPFNQIVSWIILFVVPISPFFVPRLLLLRLLSIYFSLGVVSLLFSNNHDALFLPIFSFHLFLWVLMESSIVDTCENIELLELKFQFNNVANAEYLKSCDFRQAFLYFFYTVFSFFGTGNIASINSFDTLWVRCFITIFAPFTMMILILIKIIIPFFVTACTFRAVNEISYARVDKMFLIVMLYCDLLGLNFLFFVKNVGSWLEIGESVSHYVISQVIIMFLVLLYFLSGFLTSGRAPEKMRRWMIKLKTSSVASSHVD